MAITREEYEMQVRKIERVRDIQADVKKGGSLILGQPNDIAGKSMWKTMTAGVCGDRFQESSRSSLSGRKSVKIHKCDEAPKNHELLVRC